MTEPAPGTDAYEAMFDADDAEVTLLSQEITRRVDASPSWSPSRWRQTGGAR